MPMPESRSSVIPRSTTFATPAHPGEHLTDAASSYRHWRRTVNDPPKEAIRSVAGDDSPELEWRGHLVSLPAEQPREGATVPIAKAILFVLLGLITAGFCAFWATEMTRREKWRWPTLFQCLVGFIADFFDTLGIGSYATTTSMYRPGRVVEDEKIPGTLTVGHTLPTTLQAFIFITIVK